MGTLKVRFLSDGRNIIEPPYIREKLPKMRDLQTKYPIDRIEEVEVEGNDFLIEIDIDLIDENIISWENQQFPNEIIKGKVLELVYYKEKSNKLDKILSEIALCTINDHYRLETLGNEAIDVIRRTSESKYFPDIDLSKDYNIENIEHTIEKEVSYLKDSRGSNSKEKNSHLTQAKSHLNFDIERFKLHLDHFNINGKEGD